MGAEGGRLSSIRTLDLRAWPSTRATRPPPIHVTQESSFSDLASHPGQDGRGWGDGGGETIYKRHNQREQLETEARKKPHRPPSQGRGLSVVRGSLAHSQAQARPGQTRPGAHRGPGNPRHHRLSTCPSAVTHMGPAPCKPSLRTSGHSGIITIIISFGF